MSPSPKDKLLRQLQWFTGGTGLSVPMLTMFTSSAPRFPQAALVIPVLASVIVFLSARGIGRRQDAKRDLRRVDRYVRRGIWCLGLGIVTVFTYFALLDYCTVVDPQSETTRYWTGFGLSDWSLTAIGKAYKHTHPTYTPEDMMLAEKAFRPDGPSAIWKGWSIALASGILLVLYFLAFVLWAVGFASFAAARSLSRPT
jgi:hypothetical protein